MKYTSHPLCRIYAFITTNASCIVYVSLWACQLFLFFGVMNIQEQSLGVGGIAKRVKPLACLIFEGLLNTFQRSCWFSVPTMRMSVPFVYKLAGTCQSLY